MQYSSRWNICLVCVCPRTAGISNMPFHLYINRVLCCRASFLLSRPLVSVLILHLLPSPTEPFGNKESQFSVITQGRSSLGTVAQGYSTEGTQPLHATWKGPILTLITQIGFGIICGMWHLQCHSTKMCCRILRFHQNLHYLLWSNKSYLLLLFLPSVLFLCNVLLECVKILSVNLDVCQSKLMSVHRD